eukprot:s1294_g3.t2
MPGVGCGLPERCRLSLDITSSRAFGSPIRRAPPNHPVHTITSDETESPPQLTEDEATEVERPASAVLLAPPPAPLEKCAVGALASGSGDSQVLMIDSLQGARQEIQVDAAPEQGDLEAEVSDRDAILQSDDEALLLGEVVDGTVRTRKRTDAGFDSDSGSETPRTAEAPLEASPSPPGGEDPLPQMPIPLPQMPGVNLQPMLARANSSDLRGCMGLANCSKELGSDLASLFWTRGHLTPGDADLLLRLFLSLPPLLLLLLLLLAALGFAWPLWSLAMTRQPTSGPSHTAASDSERSGSQLGEFLLQVPPVGHAVVDEDALDLQTVSGDCGSCHR